MSGVIEDLSEEERYLWAMISDPSGLDLAEFLWIDEERPDGIWRAWPYQWSWFRCMDSQQIDQCARSVGKALDVDTPVPTLSGWKTMGELVVGDQVFDENGKPCAVTNAFDVMHGRPCFEIEFDDGSRLVADRDHQWVTGTADEPELRVHTTEEIKETLHEKHFVPVSGVWETNSATDLPIPPYVLGYWLGDGTSTAAEISVGQVDKEMVVKLIEDEGVTTAPRLNEGRIALRWPTEWSYLNEGRSAVSNPTIRKLCDAQIRELRHLAHQGEKLLALADKFDVTTASVTQIVAGQTRRDAGGWVRTIPVPFGRTLRELGVHDNKHIPDVYLWAEETQRLALLQGLMDSDGHCTLQAARCEITQKNRRLAEGIFHLLISLGQKPHWEVKQASCNGSKSTVYRIGFKPQNIQPFRFPRKAERVAMPTSRSLSRITKRRIRSVLPVASRAVRCITVDSPNHLFLVGRNGIPTHNSLSIKLRGFAFPFIHPGQEMVITAPELNHLEPITDLIENQFYACKLGRYMMQSGRSGVTHRPFKMNFKNGARIMGRIPQRDGKGVKGIHPVWLELDEAQDYPPAGWTELFETLKRGSQGAIWRAHGVTRGVRDKFFEYTQEGSGWKVHRFTAMHRPFPYWSAEERQAKIELYHGRDDPDYRRNVLGEHGDATSPIFVLHRLMSCVDDDTESLYNTDEYTHFEITDTWLTSSGTTVEQELNLPTYHTSRYNTFWVGMDVGWTNHPSEIVVFAEERMAPDEYRYYKGTKDSSKRKAVPPMQSIPRLKLVCRVTLTRIGSPDQKSAILKIIEHYRPKAFSFDATGAGLPMFQDIQADLEKPEWNFIKTVVKGYNFSGNILVDFDQTIDVNEFATKDEVIKETGIKRNTVEYATDKLRYLIDNGRFWLPWDKDLIGEFQGQTYKVTKTALNQYGKREYSLGKFHALDACRMSVLGWAQYAIEEFVKKEAQEPVIDVFFG